MVGKRIAELREEKGWTQKQLAKTTGLSKSYIAAIEEGKHPGLKTVAIIAEALGVEARTLLRGRY
ncbi:XRE family transcriptional regulator [Desulfosporosinus fructosivorans]|uniref:XRE family transcriptional regulator n=1 Tax=Desulfosporosinus fructosivorans TaxID=2018669 RepID=A0A4Z0R2B8_9FIRM|nr:helix-turn-helix transcriptional regulator [Desulfosporosinus fructosivorans]TGE36910.1 XRE family transcriptional regulator [Desulfosporosinus fructosivorans]